MIESVIEHYSYDGWFLLGRLGLDNIPYQNVILIGTFIAVVILAAIVLGIPTYYRKWGYLWREWFTSIDHKKIGIMYFVIGIVMLVRGFSDAIMMRLQQAFALGSTVHAGYLPPEHFNQLFSVHGVIMILFVAMPLIIGLFNVALPLQIGTRDVAFPYLNNLSLWLTAAGAILIMISLFIGNFDRAGWLAYPPLSELKYSPGPGVDYFIWALEIAGFGTLFTGINFLVTIIKQRAPGMTLMKMPVFSWTTLCTSLLIIAAFPVLTAALALLAADRYLGTHFFTVDGGGSLMMYVNLIWVWGHPEVYIVILPLFGVMSEVVPTFSRKPLFGYTSMVYATMAIAILSYLVWLHHFFTMGGGPSLNSFFGITSMVIAIPTGVKIFNWMFTMYRGKVRFTVPMLWALGFLFTFTIGGVTGIMLAIPPVDFVLHNSLFLVAHFHNVLIGGTIFGVFCAMQYWGPKVLGFHLDEFWGKVTFWCWLIGFWVAFTPLYVLGLMGVTRRLQHYSDPSLQIWFQIALVGAVIIGIGILALLIQIYVSIRDRDSNRLRDDTGDSWGTGRTLEWSTSSPAPHYNFAFTPVVHTREPWLDMKERGYKRPKEDFNQIHMPKNTATGVVISAFSLVGGFALVWWIWWLAAICAFGILGSIIVHSFHYDRDYHISADEVAETEAEFTRQLEKAGQNT